MVVTTILLPLVPVNDSDRRQADEVEDRTLISSSHFRMVAHRKHVRFASKKRKNALIGARQSRALGRGEQVDRPQDDGSQPGPDRRVRCRSENDNDDLVHTGALSAGGAEDAGGADATTPPTDLPSPAAPRAAGAAPAAHTESSGSSIAQVQVVRVCVRAPFHACCRGPRFEFKIISVPTWHCPPPPRDLCPQPPQKRLKTDMPCTAQAQQTTALTASVTPGYHQLTNRCVQCTLSP